MEYMKIYDVQSSSSTGRGSWSSLHLSSNTILDIYKVSAMGRKDVLNSTLFAQGGEVLYMDHTFREVKHISIRGTRPAAVLTIMNERGQIVRQMLVRTKSLHDLRDSLQAGLPQHPPSHFFFLFLFFDD